MKANPIYWILNFFAWLWLVVDEKTCAELPQVKHQKKKKAEKYKPF